MGCDFDFRGTTVVKKVTSECPGVSLVRPFQGSARVQISFGEEREITQETVLLLLALVTSWGRAVSSFPL